MMLLIKYLIFCLLINAVICANILAVFPVPSYSHQIVFRSYTQELAKRGHHLTIITPNPVHGATDNITEIDVSFAYNLLKDAYKEFSAVMTRGVIIEPRNVHLLVNLVAKIVDEEFGHPEVRKLVADDTRRFDLIVLEGFIEYTLILTKIFDAPVIQISSYYGTPENYEGLGAPTRHPILYPNYNKEQFKPANIWEKVASLFQEWATMTAHKNIVDINIENMWAQRFGVDYSIGELRRNVEVLLLNSHEMLDNNRPVPPGVVYLGSGMHMSPVQELPQDLQSYLDSSSRGVIYVSLGTNVHPLFMAQDLQDAFLEAFAKLPYDILWKLDGEYKLSDNVKIGKWFPQRDLLTHRNIKLFITQGGLQSTDEAIHAGVPFVGIPMLGDQWFNMHKYVEMGIAIKLDSKTMTSNDLVEAVHTVIHQDSYRENVDRIRRIYRDQAQTPLQRAIWWTEYVIRHKGVKHLRAPSADVSWSEYYMVDVLGVLLLTSISIIGVIFVLINYIRTNYSLRVFPKAKPL